MKHTVDNTTHASTPGQIQISKRKYFNYIKLTGFMRLKYHLLFSFPQNFLFKLFHSDNIVFDFTQKTEQFKYGCLNPTVVINKDKGLIATFTNLTSYGTDITPVIKISKEPLELISNVEIKNGKKLPTVALYMRNVQDEFATAWSDFDPKVANCFTDDLEACNKLLSRISANGWKCLENGLNQIDNKERTGLYYVDLDVELVRNAY